MVVLQVFGLEEVVVDGEAAIGGRAVRECLGEEVEDGVAYWG